MQGQMWSSGAQRRYGRYQEKARCPTRCQTLKGGAFPRKSNQEQASRMPLQAARVPFPHKAKCPGHPLLALPCCFPVSPSECTRVAERAMEARTHCLRPEGEMLPEVMPSRLGCSRIPPCLQLMHRPASDRTVNSWSLSSSEASSTSKLSAGARVSRYQAPSRGRKYSRSGLCSAGRIQLTCASGQGPVPHNL